MSEEEIMTCWYAYAADEPGFVGYWLDLLRVRQAITPDQQQKEFGANHQTFLRLRAMPLPRSQALASDAHRIAEACGLKNQMAFVQAMLLASNLIRATNQSATQEFYQAAFDVDEELDGLPDKE